MASNRKNIHANVVFVLLSFFSLTAVHASLFIDDDARARIEVVKRQVDAVSQQLDSYRQNIERAVQQGERQDASAGRIRLEISNQLDELRSEQARVRGKLELLTNELELASKRQKDLYVDLDSRLGKLELAQRNTVEAADKAKTVTVAPLTAPSSEEVKVFDAALGAFKSGRFDIAEIKFRGFLVDYPQSALATSARYWLGSTYYAQHDNKKALALFRELVVGAPNDPKVPEALLNIAVILHDTGNKLGAKKTLEQLLAKYSKSAVATAARQKLDEWN